MAIVTGGTWWCGGAQKSDLRWRDGVTRLAYGGSHQQGRGDGTDEALVKAGTSTTTKREVSFMKSFLLLLVAALSVAACSSDGDGALPASSSSSVSAESAGPTTSTTAVATTESPTSAPDSSESDATSTTAEPSEQTTDSPEQIEAVLADRIRGYFEARGAANAAPAPNPADPRLAEVAVGKELAAVVASTEARRDAGEAIRPGDAGLADIRVGFVDAGASGATAAACSIDDGVIYDLATDAVVNDDVVTHNYQIDLELHDGAWKVSRIVRVQQWEGVAGCALSVVDYPY